ncbi:MAG TPA: YihY/virulence factor BrkB family protein [Bacillota bacterium]|jgi:membrane protein|nr:YihY/virulence factor BrkB family protein [Bacillota bacterium]
MDVKRAGEVITNVYIRMQKPYYQGVAAELAFFFLLSMVPLFIIVGELLGVFSLSLDVLEGLLMQYVSAEVAGSLKEYISYTPSGTISALFLLFALWSASKAQFSMIRIANYTYTGLNSGRGFIRERLRAMVTVVATIILLAFSLTILVYGKQIADVAGLYAEKIMPLSFRFNELWYILRWPAGIAFYFFGITFINFILPSEKLPVKKIIPGSIVASTGMLIVTWAYSLYNSGFSNYDLFYGGLASVVGLLIWFYVLGYVIVIGIVFNAALMETK